MRTAPPARNACRPQISNEALGLSKVRSATTIRPKSNFWYMSTSARCGIKRDAEIAGKEFLVHDVKVDFRAVRRLLAEPHDENGTAHRCHRPTPSRRDARSHAASPGQLGGKACCSSRTFVSATLRPTRCKSGAAQAVETLLGQFDIVAQVREQLLAGRQRAGTSPKVVQLPVNRIVVSDKSGKVVVVNSESGAPRPYVASEREWKFSSLWCPL